MRVDSELGSEWGMGTIEPFELHHVAMVARATVGVEGWVDGTLVVDEPFDSTFNVWDIDDALRLSVGNDPSSTRPYLGRIYYLAIYCSAVPADELQERDPLAPPG